MVYATAEGHTLPEVAVVPALIALLGDPHEDLQIGAAHALSLLGPKGAGASEALTRCLGAADDEVQLAAASALSCVDPTVKAGVPILMQALQGNHPHMQRWAEEALRRLSVGVPGERGGAGQR